LTILVINCIINNRHKGGVVEIMKNIIFYFTDQQRADTICTEVTPNIDRLAREGVKFDNAFTCQPVCGPARACLQTGLYASENGCYINGISIDKDYQHNLADELVGLGYDTAYVGKWHLASDTNGGKTRNNLQKKAVPKHLRAGYNDYWMAADCLEFTSCCYGGYVFDKDNAKVEFDGVRSDTLNGYATEYIKAKKDSEKPFFLFVSQLEPHHQNTSNTFECVTGLDEQFKDYPVPDDLLAYNSGDYKAEYAKYLASCNRLDTNFNDLVQCVIDSGLWDNTVIIYSSDHGCHFKTRNMEYKRSCHDSSIHVPLIMIGGGVSELVATAKSAGVVDGYTYNGMVSLIDIPSTIIALAGGKVPVSYQGDSIIDMLENCKAPDHVFLQISESQLGRAIRTKEYTYSVKKRASFGIESASSKVYIENKLYDNIRDPHQLNNLVRSKAHAGVRNDLRAILLADIKRIEGVTPKIKAKLL